MILSYTFEMEESRAMNLKLSGLRGSLPGLRMGIIVALFNAVVIFQSLMQIFRNLIKA